MAMSSQDKISLIVDWAVAHPKHKFDTTFVYQMQERLDLGYELSPAQERALENIITKWQILGRY